MKDAIKVSEVQNMYSQTPDGIKSSSEEADYAHCASQIKWKMKLIS